MVVHGEAEVVTLALEKHINMFAEQDGSPDVGGGENTHVDTVRAEMPAKMMDSFMIDCGRRRCVISCAGRLVLIEAKIGRCG